jgi:hypothetical protein
MFRTSASVAGLAVALAMTLTPQSALATTPSEGTGTFTFTGAPTITSVRFADGNVFVEGTAAGTLTGPLTGTFTQEFSQVVHKDGDTNFRGILICACSVDGRVGTIESRPTGTGAGTPENPSVGRFVLQNGTGGLATLHGEGKFTVVGAAGTYTLRWHFDP